MQIIINKDQKELKEHGNYAFPFRISYEELENYERNIFLWHWHPEIELTLFLEGEMEYQINDTLYHVKEGDALFCNSNALHAGQKLDNSNCRYMSITFHPRLLSGFSGSIMETEYVQNVITNPSFSSIHFTNSIDWHKEVIHTMNDLHSMFPNEDMNYDAMQIQIYLLQIWRKLYHHMPELTCLATSTSHQYANRLKTILSYIETHYTESITLEEIAKEINLCKSECCRFFKKHMNQSLFDYILTYRIEQSFHLLLNTDNSITAIADQVGFTNPCYFGKVFKEQTGCTPTQYRKNGKTG